MAHLSLAVLLENGDFLNKAIGREDGVEGLNIDRIHGVLNLRTATCFSLGHRSQQDEADSIHLHQMWSMLP